MQNLDYVEDWAEEAGRLRCQLRQLEAENDVLRECLEERTSTLNAVCRALGIDDGCDPVRWCEGVVKELAAAREEIERLKDLLRAKGLLPKAGRGCR